MSKIDILKEIKDEILLFSTQKDNFSYAKSKNASQNLIDFASSYDISLIELFWLAKNNLSDFPKCPVCGNPVRTFYQGSIYCSNKCVGKSELCRRKMKDTMLKKYGVEHALQSKEFLQKATDTMVERFGVEHALQNKEIKNKQSQTVLDKFGTLSSFSSEVVKEKIKTTMLERYGVEYSSQRQEWKDVIKKKWENITFEERAERLEKSKETSRLKFGVESYSQSPEGRQKIKERVRKTSKILLEKRKKTCLDRYGVEFPMKFKDVSRKSSLMRRKQYYSVFLDKLKKRNIQYLGTEKDFVEKDNEIQYQCLNCGHIFWTRKRSVIRIYCPECAKYHLVSKKEFEIIDFIKEIYSREIIKNTRKIISPYELDIYIPEKKLGIEFNGSYWHSEIYKDVLYHQDKFLKCYYSGIQLLQIFEHEWIQNEELCKSYIKSSLGIFENVIQNPKIEYVDKNKTNSFIRENSFMNEDFDSGIALIDENEIAFILALKNSAYFPCIKAGHSVRNCMSFLDNAINQDFLLKVDASKYNPNDFEVNQYKLIAMDEPSFSIVQNHRVHDAGRMVFQKCD